MDIKKTKYEDLKVLVSWITDKDAAYVWTGLDLRFPIIEKNFVTGIGWGNISAYSAYDEQGNLIGFGQFYVRLGKCHLARLIISPDMRDKRIGRKFIAELIKIGIQETGLPEVSLFVSYCNHQVIRCYESLGFVRDTYPPGNALYDSVLYMVLGVSG